MSGISDPSRYPDKEARDYLPLFKTMRRDYVRKFITPELIAEYAGNPLGIGPNFHSLPLQAVMAYFRTMADRALYMPIELPSGKGFSIVASRPGEKPEVLEDLQFATVDEARAAIFRRRVDELQAQDA